MGYSIRQQFFFPLEVSLWGLRQTGLNLLTEVSSLRKIVVHLYRVARVDPHDDGGSHEGDGDDDYDDTTNEPTRVMVTTTAMTPATRVTNRTTRWRVNQPATKKNS